MSAICATAVFCWCIFRGLSVPQTVLFGITGMFLLHLLTFVIFITLLWVLDVALNAVISLLVTGWLPYVQGNSQIAAGPTYGIMDRFTCGAADAAVCVMTWLPRSNG